MKQRKCIYMFFQNIRRMMCRQKVALRRQQLTELMKMRELKEKQQRELKDKKKDLLKFDSK